MDFKSRRKGIRMNFSLLIASKGRAHNLKNLVNNIFDTATRPEEVEILFLVEERDPESYAVLSAIDHPRIIVKVINSEEMNSNFSNVLLPLARRSIFMVAADDLKFNTIGWDQVVEDKINSYSDGIVLITPNDGVRKGEIATHFFVTKRWVDAMGYITPPHFTAEYADTWMTHVAQRLDRFVYLPLLNIEHLHHSVGKSEYDATYQEKDGRSHIDKLIWEKFGEEGVSADVEKLKKVIER